MKCSHPRVRLVVVGLLCGLLTVAAPAAGESDLQLVQAARSRDWDAVAALLSEHLAESN